MGTVQAFSTPVSHPKHAKAEERQRQHYQKDALLATNLCQANSWLILEDSGAILGLYWDNGKAKWKPLSKAQGLGVTSNPKYLRLRGHYPLMERYDP